MMAFMDKALKCIVAAGMCYLFLAVVSGFNPREWHWIPSMLWLFIVGMSWLAIIENDDE